MSQEVANLILPFVVSSKDRKTNFTKEMETATIFYIAESNRSKGEGILMKKPREEILFINKFYYPIWLISWKGKSLFFDGLGVTLHKLTYEILPDIKKFIDDVEGSTENFESYSAALSDHKHYFKCISGVEEKTILGLITCSDFIEDFRAYISDAEQFDQSNIKTSFLSPVIDESCIAVSLNELTELKTALEKDIGDLRQAMELLNSSTREHIAVIRKSMREIQIEFDEKIEIEKTLAREKTREIQKKYDDKITTASKRFEQHLQRLRQERVKMEKAEQRATSQIDRYKAEIEAAENDNSNVIQKKCKQEIENLKRETKMLQKNIEQLDERIEKTESQKKIEITNLRSEFNSQAEKTLKNVRELEASRDAKRQLNQQKIKSLEDSSSTIMTQLDNLAKHKRESRNNLDKMGISNRKKSVLVYVPFYLACFQAETERRYLVLPPSIVGTLGVLTKLKGVLRVSRVKSLFQQRSKPVANVLNQLVTLIESDPVFKRDLHDAVAKANILENEEKREMLKRGLEELRSEEWISENEFQILCHNFIANKE